MIQFNDWVRDQINANGSVGQFARFVFGLQLPTGERKMIRSHLKIRLQCDEKMLKAFDTSYRVYREQT